MSIMRFVLLVVLLLCSCTVFDDDAGPPSPPGIARVARVVDGDTIDVEIGDDRERVRLIGIDTPETVDPRRPVECFGAEASTHIAELLPEGTAVRLERDVEPRDNFGRLLAYVFRRSDDLFVNLEMVEDGYAVPLTRPPNVAYVDQFVAAADAARAQGQGLWSACPDEQKAQGVAVASSRADPLRASGLPP